MVTVKHNAKFLHYLLMHLADVARLIASESIVNAIIDHPVIDSGAGIGRSCLSKLPYEYKGETYVKDHFQSLQTWYYGIIQCILKEDWDLERKKAYTMEVK